MKHRDGSEDDYLFCTIYGGATLVDIDFDLYRRKNDMRAVRRNVTLPAYLDYAASESGVNVSAILQAALKKALNIE